MFRDKKRMRKENEERERGRKRGRRKSKEKEERKRGRRKRKEKGERESRKIETDSFDYGQLLKMGQNVYLVVMAPQNRASMKVHSNCKKYT